MAYLKYRVRQGKQFVGVTQREKSGGNVFFPEEEDVSAFEDKLELVGKAKVAEVKSLNLTPPTPDQVGALAEANKKLAEANQAMAAKLAAGDEGETDEKEE